MVKQSLLVADADPRSLRILEVALRKAGFSVGTATDGAEALRRLQRTPPDLLICDVSLPSQEGLSLCRAVRAEARIAGLPLLMMSADASVRASALEAGADDFLGKPLLIKELVSRVRLLLERREKQKNAQRESPAALTGTVGDLGLVDLFQSLESWKKSATVFCEDGARTARVWVRDGEVIDAEVLPLHGDSAFYRLLNWETGSFRVEFGPVALAARIAGGTQALIAEAMRRLDALGRTAELLPLGMQLSVDFARLSQRLAELPDEVNGVLRQLDGKRTLQEAMDLSPLDDLSTLAVVQRLIGEGVLRTAEQKPDGLRVKPSLQQWLGEGIPSAAASEPGRERSAAAPVAVAVAEQAPAPAPAEVAAVLVRAMASAEAAAREESRAAEERAAAALAERPIAQEAAAVALGEPPIAQEPAAAAPAEPPIAQEPAAAVPEPAAKPLELVRFPPLRGVRRERLRREAEETRAQIAAGQTVRLTRVVEVPGWEADGSDAPAPGARRISPAVGQAAKKFAPDLPIARLRSLPKLEAQRDPVAPAIQTAAAAAQPGAPDAAATLEQAPAAAAPVAASDAPASSEGVATASALEVAVAPAAWLAEPSVAAAEPAVVEPLAASPAAAEAVAAPAVSEPAAAEAVAAPAVSEPAAAEAVAAPAAVEPAAAEPVAAEPAAAEPVAAEAVAAEPVAAGPVAGGPVAAGPVAATKAPAFAARRVPADHESFADVVPARAVTRRPIPAVAAEDEAFEAELRAALGGKRRRWPWIAAAAAAVLVGAFALRSGPATDKKDSPWLEGGDAKQVVARPPEPKPAHPEEAKAHADAKPSAEATAEAKRPPDAKPPATEATQAAAKPAVAAAIQPAAAAAKSADSKGATAANPAAATAANPAAAPVANLAAAPVANPAAAPADARQATDGKAVAAQAIAAKATGAQAAVPPAHKPPESKTVPGDAVPPPAVAAAGLVPTPSPDDYARSLEEGEKLLKRGKYRQAVAELKHAVQLNPESVPALLALGDAYLEADAARNALKPLQKAAALDPRNGRAQLLLGTAFQSFGKNADAVKAYQRYLELQPAGEFASDVRSILANLQR